MKQARMRGAIMPSRVRGQATLAMVFVIGGIILFAAISIALLVISFLASSYGFESATTAQAAASAGVEDAIVRMNRQSDFRNGTVSPYSFSVGPTLVSVTITPNSPVGGQTTILSQATVKNYQQSYRAIISVNSSTGQLDLQSWQ